MDISNNIKTIRNLLGQKQSEFAAILGISVPQLKSYENMGVKPKLPVQLKIASMAGITIEQLHHPDTAIFLSSLDSIQDKKDKSERPGSPANEQYLSLLRSNDAFFKQQFSAYSNQIIGNLNVLHRQTKYIESLLQVSLKHIGKIEASQNGSSPEDIWRNIEEDLDDQIAEGITRKDKSNML